MHQSVAWSNFFLKCVELVKELWILLHVICQGILEVCQKNPFDLSCRNEKNNYLSIISSLKRSIQIARMIDSFLFLKNRKLIKHYIFWINIKKSVLFIILYKKKSPNCKFGAWPRATTNTSNFQPIFSLNFSNFSLQIFFFKMLFNFLLKLYLFILDTNVTSFKNEISFFKFPFFQVSFFKFPFSSFLFQVSFSSFLFHISFHFLKFLWLIFLFQVSFFKFPFTSFLFQVSFFKFPLSSFLSQVSFF